MKCTLDAELRENHAEKQREIDAAIDAMKQVEDALIMENAKLRRQLADSQAQKKSLEEVYLEIIVRETETKNKYESQKRTLKEALSSKEEQQADYHLLQLKYAVLVTQCTALEAMPTPETNQQLQNVENELVKVVVELEDQSGSFETSGERNAMLTLEETQRKLAES